MLFAILLLFCSAVCGMIFTILNSRCAITGANFNIVQGENAGAMCLFSLVMAGLLHQFPESIDKTLIVLTVHFLAGVSAFWGIVFTARAMKCGHNGLTATIVNANLIFPCLSGILFFGDILNTVKALSLIAVLIGIGIIGFAKSSGRIPEYSNKRRWLISLAGALLCCGISGCLNIALSYFPEMQARPIFRTAGNCLGGFCCYLLSIRLVPPLGLNRLPSRREVAYIAIAFSSSILSCYVFTYNAFDQLAKLNLAGIASPIIVGFTTVGFMLYSTLVFREKMTLRNWIGFFCIVIGILFIAFYNS